MKKQSILAMVIAAGLIGSAATPVQAAGSRHNLNEKLQSKNCVTVGGQINSISEIQSILEQQCNGLQNENWKDCLVIKLPNCNQPEINAPDSNTPDTNEPDTDIPETNQPDTDVPDENIPDINQPDFDIPETNVPDNNTPDTNVPEVDTNEPETDKEENSFAEQVVKLVNAERAKAGLNALTLDKEIASAALVRAKEIETSFSHTRPDGRSFSSVLTDYGIRFSGSGENIAWGQISPEKVMEAWMNSEGHRANILNPKFTKIGVGHYQNANGRNFWAQLFTY